MQLTSQPQIDRRGMDREAVVVPTTVQLTLHEEDGNRMINSQILSISYSGLGVTCNQPLAPGTKLTYIHPTRNKPITARIAWCKRNEAQGFEHGVANEAFEAGARVDHYAILQVNIMAEPATIDAAYERLANKYHPGNGINGNPVMYQHVVNAYNVLSDPETRTAYEGERSAAKFESGPKEVRNRPLLRSKRMRIMEMLYWRRVESPYKPIITIHEFETLMKLPKEQLEFTMWFLRERGWLTRSDNACFVITAEGITAVEEADDAGLLQPETEEESEAVS